MAGIRQFNRRASVLIGPSTGVGRQIDNLRISFEVKKTSTPEYNTARIQIYNMNKSHRDAVKSTDMRVTLSAGYPGNIQTVYSGDITSAVSEVKKPETILTIDANDGHKGLHQLKFPCSYSEGTSAKQILKDLVGKSDLGRTNVRWESLPDRSFINGLVHRGMAPELLTNLCSYLGLEWSIQDGEFQFIKVGQTNLAKVISITPDSGMIGSPQKVENIGFEQPKIDFGSSTLGQLATKVASSLITVSKPVGLKVEALLVPSAKPGGVVEVEADGWPKGLWRIVEVVHTGDTHGSDWRSSLTLMSFSGSSITLAGNKLQFEGGGATPAPDTLDPTKYFGGGV